MARINWEKIIYEAMRKTIGTPEKRKRLRAEREVLERIHGYIQSQPEPPSEGEHLNFYHHYSIKVKWSGYTSYRYIEVLVCERTPQTNYHFLGTCKFTWTERTDGTKQFRSKGISQPTI